MNISSVISSSAVSAGMQVEQTSPTQQKDPNESGRTQQSAQNRQAEEKSHTHSGPKEEGKGHRIDLHA